MLAAELSKVKVQLTADVGEYKQVAEEEQAQKTLLAGQLKLLQRELCLFKGQLEEEESKRNDTQQLLARTSAELQRLKLKCKCDSAAYVEAELMEQMKRKWSTKLAESQAELARWQAKGEEMEKGRQRMVKEMRELKSVAEDLKENIVYLGKKQKQGEKSVSEWREKYEQQVIDLENSQTDLIKKSCEIQRYQAETEDAQSLTDMVCRENKNLGDEKQKLLAQLDELRASFHEAEKVRTVFQNENRELNESLGVFKRDLQASELKKTSLMQDMANYKKESLFQLNEKEEELQCLK